MDKTDMQTAEANWKSIYRLGAVAALLSVLFAVLEILITFLPGGERVSPELLTVPLWFERLQQIRCSNCATWDWSTFS
jgi:hypothetical protein